MPVVLGGYLGEVWGGVKIYLIIYCQPERLTFIAERLCYIINDISEHINLTLTH